jgi:hypothetical protein
MGSISQFLEGALLNHIFNGAGVIYTPTDPNYLGLSDADPVNDASGISEPSGGSYARIPITFSAASARSLINIIANFPEATGAWGTMSDWFICNHATNATFGTNVEMLAFGGLNASKQIVSGNAPIIPAGDISISLKTLGVKGTGENVSDYLANKLLDFVFRDQAFAQPEIYMGYATTILADNTTGSTVVEPSGSGYGRKLVNENGGSSPTWNLQSSQVVDNLHDIDLAIATGSWGTIVSQFINDALTVGNMLFYDNDGVVDQLVGVDDIVRAAAGECDIAIT